LPVFKICLFILGVVPLDIRENILSNYINYIPTQIDYKILKEVSHLETMKEFKINKEVKEIIWDTEDEIKRVKNFRRIFPSEISLNYRKFFMKENTVNTFLSLRALETSKFKLENIKKMKKVNLINTNRNKK
jgi:hypothetical protein